MSVDTIKLVTRAELFRVRANLFRGAGLAVRIPEEYQKQPNLLEADLAYLVMAALCAAQEADVELDLEGAVAAGQDLYADLIRQSDGEA